MLNQLVNRHANELWGKGRREPEWRDEVDSYSGKVTGRIVHRRTGQVLVRGRKVDGVHIGNSWRGVRS